MSLLARPPASASPDDVQLRLAVSRDIAVPPPESMAPRMPDSRTDDVAFISHELRNSLAVVRNAARLLRADRGAAGIEGARILIERHVGQMSRHIEDLLDTSRFKHGLDTLRLARVDLRQILQHTVDSIAADVARHRHQLTVSLPAEAVWVLADAARLEQVFANLLINAVKYTPDGGQISLSMDCPGDHASVRVRDSGIGIESALLTRIFDMFVRVDAAARQVEGGHGIGLAVVRKLVEKHGGTVWAQSAGLRGGSEFTVTLPALCERPAEAKQLR